MRTQIALAAAALGLGGCGSADKLPDETPSTVEQVSEQPTGGKSWVTAERIDRRTCPSTDCGVVGTLDFREAAAVEERKGKWARVSRYYDASCVNGRSEYVYKGNSACVAANGIVDGKFAEWVEARNLSETRPKDPAETADADEQLVKGSDDFTRYRRQFVTAARTLMDRGECAAGDFQEQGGFMKSTNHRDEPIYFTYCGGFTTANRIYINAKTGEIFR